jgi:predicted RNA-binding protein YlqC (UPF0109 family)
MPHPSQPDMVALMKGIAMALVDRPDEVLITAIDGGDRTTLRLEVAASDIGKVIGKQGRTARSLRTILSAAAMKHGHPFGLDIVESGNDAEQV